MNKLNQLKIKGFPRELLTEAIIREPSLNSGKSGLNDWVTWHLNGRLLASKLSHLNEIVPAFSVTPFKVGTNRFSGLFNVRGQIVHLISENWIGEATTIPPIHENTEPISNYIIFNHGKNRYALPANRLGGIIPGNQAQVKQWNAGSRINLFEISYNHSSAFGFEPKELLK